MPIPAIESNPDATPTPPTESLMMLPFSTLNPTKGQIVDTDGDSEKVTPQEWREFTNKMAQDIKEGKVQKYRPHPNCMLGTDADADVVVACADSCRCLRRR